jgi:hypothetical protein
MSGMSDRIDSAATSELTSDSADIDTILKRIEGCVTAISLGFEGWNDLYARVDRGFERLAFVCGCGYQYRTFVMY